MPELEKMFKAKLFFLNGVKINMLIPGIEKEDGLILIPESVTIDSGQFFKLDKGFRVLEYFKYDEIINKKIIPPFREDLH